MSYISRDKTGKVRKGEKVDELLDKIEDLKEVTYHENGVMLGSDKFKLDSLEDDEELTLSEINALLNF